ncbi:hypothetical protein PVAND_015663 [Polypedilum vanderplanki]|uniref:Major facilitator superfamily (MFS) profile domain-containing protein n=1 Tax=Polypedilum vanderplanki TaxID=319348 RepID=A0A9J6BDU2_POLVA|nr:hypothetical protein PVAND_015663 [Polypedilum vanderplanki]
MIFNIFKSESSTKNQYVATIAINIITLAHGCAIAWVSPTSSYLKSNETHLTDGPITATQSSWIGSLISIGALINTFCYGKIADILGKKISLIILLVPNVIFWLLIYFSTNVIHIYIARAIAGLTGGGLLRILPLFTGEIAESHVRGKLGAYFPLAMYGGMLLIFILGTYLDFFTIPLVMLPFSIIFFFCMIFLPETPQYYLKKGENLKALESLKFYRSCSRDNEGKVKNELESLRNAVNNVNIEKIEVKDFVEKSTLRGLSMSFFLTFIASFSGNFAIMTYTADIFESSGSSLKPNESAMIVAFIQFIGIYVASICVDKFGRKILMSISCGGSSLFLCLMATYAYLNDTMEIPNDLKWLPIFAVSCAIFLNAIGVASLPFMIITELVPHKIREFSVMIFMALLTLFGFCNLKVFPILTEIIELHGCIWIYSGICLFGTFITIFVMPETKGKNLFQNK